MLDHAYLHEIIHYSIITGNFYWIKSKGAAKAGNLAGNIRPDGYRKIKINGKKYFSHRLAWFWIIGCWPENEIDHINGIKDANYWLNLREATRSQNNCNTGMRSDNTSGCKGVSWREIDQKWCANITLAGKQKYIGAYATREMAYEERLKAEKAMHGDFAKKFRISA